VQRAVQIAFGRQQRQADGPPNGPPDGTIDLQRWLAAGQPTDLVVLPERWLAVPTASDGPAIASVRAACRAARQALLFGYCEACSGEVFSALQLIDERGIAIANYRCTHPSDDGLGIGRWLTIVPWRGHRLAFLAGHDLFAPEAWRAAALAGATAMTWVGVDWPASAGALLQTRAIECGLPVVGSNGSSWAGFEACGRPLGETSPGEFVLGLPQPARFPARRQPVLYRVLTEEHAVR